MLMLLYLILEQTAIHDSNESDLFLFKREVQAKLMSFKLDRNLPHFS